MMMMITIMVMMMRMWEGKGEWSWKIGGGYDEIAMYSTNDARDASILAITPSLQCSALVQTSCLSCR
jgi:hypothetical protein